ncbi:MAG: chlorophyll synthesis pathway protein BchC, partial [Pseudomonadota bacterium]
LSYPLVPGYETIGTVVEAKNSKELVGQRVFAAGSKSFKGASGLFGGTASRLVVPSEKVTPVAADTSEDGVLLALAATAHHAISGGNTAPDLIVGHGVLGRLIARLTIALFGTAPTVWEKNPDRVDAADYIVCDPDADDFRAYKSVYDVSGDTSILDHLVSRLSPRGQIVLAGFYAQRINFSFPQAFMKEARFRIAAEWTPDDLQAVLSLIDQRKLDLSGLVTHHFTPDRAQDAYATAFNDPKCLKLVIDWRSPNGATI